MNPRSHQVTEIFYLALLSSWLNLCTPSCHPRSKHRILLCLLVSFFKLSTFLLCVFSRLPEHTSLARRPLRSEAVRSPAPRSRSPSPSLPAELRQSNKTGNALLRRGAELISAEHLCSMDLRITPSTPIFWVILSTLPLCIFIYIDMTQLGCAVVEACIIFNDIKCRENHAAIRKMSVLGT